MITKAQYKPFRLLAIFLSIFVLGAFTLPGYGQFRASIQGTVADPTGAVIPGATVTLTDTSTNHSMMTTSSGAGVYTFNALPPNVFDMKVAATGFKSKTLSDIHITPEQANLLNTRALPVILRPAAAGLSV